MKRRPFLLLMGAPVVAPAFAQAAPPRIVASFSILADIVRQVAPPDAEVHALVGADADAHVYQPTPADARRLAQADMVVVNGLGFEGWITRLVKVSGFKGALVTASQGIAPRKAGADAHGHGHDVDPHAWHDLAHARAYVRTVAAALATRWPARAAEVGQRRDAYLAQIDRLEAALRERLAAVPRAQRRVISSHDAFGYLGAAWGIDFLSPQGWTTGSEPSAAAVGRLVRQIREQAVRAVFIENISDPRLVERIAREAQARVGGTLYSDALSAPGGPADSYLKLYEHNLRTIADALKETAR